jgi:hypothetical protein
MRYHWGLGVGHTHVHRPTSASGCIPNQPMDVETLDNVPTVTDPEAMSANEDLEVTTANTTSQEFPDSEMVLEDCDPEGWDDVESDSSEGGNIDDHDVSEDDFGDIYE